jgi:hypothetical protein
MSLEFEWNPAKSQKNLNNTAFLLLKQQQFFQIHYL